jgi:hypothetical protein
MREELRHLENHLVFCRGRVVEKRSAPDDQVDVLLKKTLIRPWNGFDPIPDENDGTEIETDHLWLRMNRDSCDAELLMKAHVIGEVYFYRRSDFSVDLGVRSAPAMDLDDLVTMARELCADRTDADLAKAKQARQLIAVALNGLLHQGEGGWAWSRYFDSEEAARQLARSLACIHRTIEATEKRLATVRKNGRCKGINQLSVPRHRLRTAAGF